MVVYINRFLKSEYENIETLSLSADYYRCQCLHLTAISCLLFLLHIYIKSNISQLLDTLTASSDLLSIPQSPVRVCLSAPIDIINWRACSSLFTLHQWTRTVTGWMSAVYGESPYCRAQKPFAETTPWDACWLITSSFIVRVMYMYLCVCEWLAWMPPGVHLFVSWLWDEACVGGRMFIELVIRLNEWDLCLKVFPESLCCCWI